MDNLYNKKNYCAQFPCIKCLSFESLNSTFFIPYDFRKISIKIITCGSSFLISQYFLENDKALSKLSS